ncbi:uncharacterized protein RAG0_16170 [Rhynchosporium agropyri]|uniref:Uncharacterized protein n=1 Tax=Rhynchosporium agropyri TaxID=914238 RepID=A0A1E1LP74_9HELO|nr:uncharacterized protein RAG0_16170 [Rhynchosporium agropyri]
MNRLTALLYRSIEPDTVLQPSPSEETRWDYANGGRHRPWTADVFLEYSQARDRVHDKKRRSQSYTRRPENRRQVLPIKIGNQTYLACPDSGSGKNMTNPAFVAEKKLKMREGPKDNKPFELGSGKVLGLDWRNPVTAAVEPVPIDIGTLPVNLEQHNRKIQPETPIEAGDRVGIVFHVLPGLPADVVFGRDLLETTDAFNLCPDLTSTTGSSNNILSDEFNILIYLGPVSRFFSIFRRDRRSTQLVDPEAEHERGKHSESRRRYQMDMEIESLSEAVQDAARREEEEMKGGWAAKHVACVYCTPV